LGEQSQSACGQPCRRTSGALRENEKSGLRGYKAGKKISELMKIGHAMRKDG
jgi:hypothetical protein